MSPPPALEAPTHATSIIYLEDVTVNYDGFKALSRLNFFMERRELRVVIGRTARARRPCSTSSPDA